MCPDEVSKLINNPLKLRESYWINNHKDVYNIIIDFTKSIDLPFKQRIWHYINSYPNEFICECGNKTNFNKNWKDGYKKFCSSKCAQSSTITKNKRINTCILKYGFDNASKSDIVKNKQAKTNIDRYGYKSSFQNENVREKWQNSIISKYGVNHYFKSDKFKMSAKYFYFKKLGVEHPLLDNIIKDKIKNTCLDRYGVTTYLNTKHARDNIKKYNKSKLEIEIFDFIKSMNIEVIHSNKTMLYPNHIDILVPDKNLAIEFNGLYWHSEFFKNKNYHLLKTLGCVDKNINLLHIWEDDWLNKKNIIKSIICNKLGIITNKIFARKCKIKEVNNEDTSIFLNNNHIQGYSRFNKSYGLYYNDELVSLMTFGYRYINSKKEYELIRFCNKINTSVIGSASKLLKYAINNLNKDINKIVSYADISMFNGSLYKKLGFEYIRRSDVNYWWVVNGIRKHRFTYNKSKLVKQGHDPLKTEVEIMHSLGNYRIYGCGQDKYILNI